MWNKRLLFRVSVNQEARNQTHGEGTSKQHLEFVVIRMFSKFSIKLIITTAYKIDLIKIRVIAFHPQQWLHDDN